jgi:hypothetical protein
MIEDMRAKVKTEREERERTLLQQRMNALRIVQQRRGVKLEEELESEVRAVPSAPQDSQSV